MLFACIFGKDCRGDPAVQPDIELHFFGGNADAFGVNDGFIIGDDEKAGDLGVAADGAERDCRAGLKVNGAEAALGDIAHSPVHGIRVVIICHALTKFDDLSRLTYYAAGAVGLGDCVKASVHRDAVELAAAVGSERNDAGGYLCDFGYRIVVKVYRDEIASVYTAFIIRGFPGKGIGYCVELTGGIIKGHVAPAVICASVIEKELTAPVGGVYLIEPAVLGKTVDAAAHVRACAHVGIIIEGFFLGMLVRDGARIACEHGYPAEGKGSIVIPNAVAVDPHIGISR